MDKYQRWTGVYWSLLDILNEWNRRRKAGMAGKRDHEIHAATLLAISLAQQNQCEYVLGIQLLGYQKPALKLGDLFDPTLGLDRDVDLVMVSIVNGVPRQDLVHPLQITRILGATSQDPDESVRLIMNSIRRKLRAPTDDKLILLMHLEGPGRSDYFKLHSALVANKCPFGQAFVVGQYAPPEAMRWFCIQVFPDARKLRDLDFSSSPLDPWPVSAPDR